MCLWRILHDLGFLSVFILQQQQLWSLQPSSSDSLWFWGQIRLGLPKGSTLPVSCASLEQRVVASDKVLWRVPPTVLLYMSPSLMQSSEANASEKILWRVPTPVLYIHMYPSLLRLSGAKGCCFRKVFRGFPQMLSTYVPQSPTRLSVAWILNIFHPFTSTLRRCWGILWAYLFFVSLCFNFFCFLFFLL